MSDFVVVRNLKSPLGDVHITGGVPEDNVDYSLMVDVSLYEVREKKGTGEEEPDKTFIFVPTGEMRLINLQKINERSAGIQESNTETTAGDSAGVSAGDNTGNSGNTGNS